ncbi:hypothetical protein [Lacrimispora xylanolytica]|uniref:Uncharacterized protein n=2 Tax=Clostridia TaxID=186801 RepID=A0ABY7AEX7_9FIRM|nr:hypothetical protein [Lacrimispora xylanolytica]WAJ24066.1 hypothetical protein OW255_00615 [Lacrimispora xylanolytica]
MAECMEERNGCTVIKQYYGCCEGNGNSGTGAENVYSTDETVCGTWIDGKPIYRKVITGTLANDSGNNIVFATIPELNIEQLINIQGNMIYKNKAGHIVFPVSYASTNGLFAAINMAYNEIKSTLEYHFLNNGGDYSGCTANVIIEYTKK